MSLPITQTVRQSTPFPAASQSRSAPPRLSVIQPDADFSDGPDGDEAAPSPRHFESWYGLAVSLGVHLALIAGLAFIVFETSDRSVGSISGVLGNPDEDAAVDFLAELDFPTKSGGSDEPMEVFDRATVVGDIGSMLNPTGRLIGGGSGTGDGEGEGDGNGAGIAVPAIAVPGHAVTKGSFSAWTDPEDPAPRENYFIHILMRLPERLANLKEFPANDLSGVVRGTDDYVQKISFRSGERFVIQGGAVQIKIFVPGGERRVRDRITVRSTRLKERQTIDLEF